MCQVHGNIEKQFSLLCVTLNKEKQQNFSVFYYYYYGNNCTEEHLNKIEGLKKAENRYFNSKVMVNTKLLTSSFRKNLN